MDNSKVEQSLQAPDPAIIGLYGISGSGKSYLLNQLKEIGLENTGFRFYDGSTFIDNVVPGGLSTFKNCDKQEQAECRAKAILHASKECQNDTVTGVIAGHAMFWENEENETPDRVGTEADWATYTHIIYFKVDPGIIAARRARDTARNRRQISEEHLNKWQEKEMKALRHICLERGILFTEISEDQTTDEKVTLGRLTALLRDFQQHSEADTVSAIDHIIDVEVANRPDLETMLVFDGDKTLSPQDTGAVFWQQQHRSDDPLKRIFQTHNYSYAAFRHVALLYEGIHDKFDDLCDTVAAEVKMYPEMIKLLRKVSNEPHVGAIVVTCGLRQVWENVLKNNGLSDIKVIGGGRLANGHVVTGPIKGHIVERLHRHLLRVIAFGDGPLDIAMFKQADRSYVVVGEEATRSRSMEKILAEVINKDMNIRQILLPSSVTPRLDQIRLPKVDLDDRELSAIFGRTFISKRFVHATNKTAAKLLMTPMRNAANSGHDLRKSHERTGHYLALAYVSEILGIEKYPINHVQGGFTDGWRYQHEENTLIVSLMRGGEPMAFGVSEALSRASFAHASEFEDIKKGNLDGKETIVLVDSVINKGDSIVEFLKPLREELPNVRIVVVVGVIQAKAVETGEFAKVLRDDPNLYVVALRLSDNSYKGKGKTDTGDRLFNTTYL